MLHLYILHTTGNDKWYEVTHSLKIPIWRITSCLFQDDQTDSSSCDSDRTENCYNPVSVSRVHGKGGVTGLEQVLAGGQQYNSDQVGQHTTSDDLSPRIVPVYWSASQLLSKLDNKQTGHSHVTRGYDETSHSHVNRGYDGSRGGYQEELIEYPEYQPRQYNDYQPPPQASLYPPQSASHLHNIAETPSIAGTVDQELATGRRDRSYRDGDMT